MATIDTEPGFDALAYAQRLKAAGVEDNRAEAARASQSGLATKADLADLEARLQAFFYRALWIQTGAIAGIVVAIVKFL